MFTSSLPLKALEYESVELKFSTKHRHTMKNDHIFSEYHIQRSICTDLNSYLQAYCLPSWITSNKMRPCVTYMGIFPRFNIYRKAAGRTNEQTDKPKCIRLFVGCRIYIKNITNWYTINVIHKKSVNNSFTNILYYSFRET